MSDGLVNWVRSLPDPTRDMFTDNERTLILKCYELADRIEELEALTQWQPIETAPKDGTVFIGAVFNPPWSESHLDGNIYRCWYQPEFDAFIEGCREMRTHNGHTFEDGTTRKLHSPEIVLVDHWMPLPAPPKGEE